MKRLVMAMIGTAVGLFVTVEPAWAYLDPGTGSLILQALTAGVAGVLMVGRLYWDRLRSLLPGSRSRREPASPSNVSSGGQGPTDRAPL